jgi:hypothetical protein
MSCRDAAKMSPMHKIEEMDRKGDIPVICNTRLEVSGKEPVTLLVLYPGW